MNTVDGTVICGNVPAHINNTKTVGFREWCVPWTVALLRVIATMHRCSCVTQIRRFVIKSVFAASDLFRLSLNTI